MVELSILALYMHLEQKPTLFARYISFFLKKIVSLWVIDIPNTMTKIEYIINFY